MDFIKKLIPTKEQYKKWTLPNKWTFWAGIIGIPIGIISLIITIFSYYSQLKDNNPQSIIQNKINKKVIMPYGLIVKYDLDNTSIQKTRSILKNIKVGINIFKIFEILGVPDGSQVLTLEDNKQKIYRTFFEYVFIKKMFLSSVITDEEGQVHYYSIVVSDYRLNPQIPVDINMRGGEDTFLNTIKYSQFGEKTFEDIFFNYSSKFAEYSETEYFGNPGNYNYYIFGINPLGDTLPGTDELMNEVLDTVVDRVNDKRVLNNFRNKAIPNSFGVIYNSSPEILFEFLKKSGIRPEYLYGRDLLW